MLQKGVKKMTLAQLRYVITVAQLGTLSSAENVYISLNPL